ncbi:MAG TPA: ATP-binding protein [Streptosporangiaceae bacterium]|nr:ATP-binding protein [Streptosporangiaceae bacterium]
MSTLTTGTNKETDLSNLSLSRKEDFLLFAETPPRVQPEQLTRGQIKALSDAARADRHRGLRVWHANLGPFETPQLAELHEDMWDIVDSNAQDGDKVKGAIAVDAFPGLGKTTAVLAFARKFHLREIAENGRFTPDGHERLPVCRVGLTGNTSMKDFNRAMLEFYGHSGRHRGTTAQMAHRALDCVQSCHCRLLVIDDLHFLRWGRTNGIEVSNHFKYIANEFPVTLVMVGVGLAGKGLFSEGDSFDDAPLAQTGRRTTPLSMQPFRIDTDQHRRQWRQLLLAIERKLVLAEKVPGMLADELSGYLFARSTGHIGSLMTLINRGCQRAVRTGAERLDQELMDRVKNDAAAEKARRELELALESRKITTRIGKKRKAPAKS